MDISIRNLFMFLMLRNIVSQVFHCLLQVDTAFHKTSTVRLIALACMVRLSSGCLSVGSVIGLRVVYVCEIVPCNMLLKYASFSMCQ